MELISIQYGHQPKQPTKVIEKMLYPEYGDQSHWKDYPPRYKTVFTIMKHGEGFMSFVEIYERDSTKVMHNGNSLWKNMPFTLIDLEAKINSYMNIPEVIKDFCI